MSIRPGPTLLALGGGLLLLGLLAFAWGSAVWFAALAILLAPVLMLRDYVDLRRLRGCIELDSDLPVCARRGLPFHVILRMTNSGPHRAVGMVREWFPPAALPDHWLGRFDLPPGGECRFDCSVRVPSRGPHAFGPAWVRLRGPTGMLEAQWRTGREGHVKVLPDSAGSGEAIRKGPLDERRILDEWARTRLRGEGLEFESISEFRDNDDPKRIDWRSTARHRRLMVRRYQLEQHRDVVVLLDCGRLMVASAGEATKLDCAVDATLMLSRVALEKGDRCGVGMFDDQVLGFLPPQAGAGAHRIILESVYGVQSRWRETDFSPMFATLESRQPKRSLVVILSDIVDADTSGRFRSALLALSKKHVVILAAIQTPLMGELVRAPIGAPLDVSRKAVAFRVLREREKALHTLERTGIHVLDVEPGQLTVPLVNRYIELRERNLV